MNFTDLPFCSSGWDIDLNSGRAICRDVDGWLYFLILLVLLAVFAALVYFTFRQRRFMQAKFTLSFNIQPAQIQAADLTFPGTVGQPESGNMQLSGGTAPYKVSVDDPTLLPPGVSVDDQGNVSGTPTAPGLFSVPVTVADAGQ